MKANQHPEKPGQKIVSVSDGEKKQRSTDHKLAEANPDERFIGQVSGLLWQLEIRALAALYKSFDEDQALRVIVSPFREPIHDGMRQRLSAAWKQAADKGGTLKDALESLDDDEAWWIRCQLPSDTYTLSETEHRARKAVAELWEELSHV